MSSFIREPWIHSLLSAQLYQNAIPSTSQRCQLIDIIGKADALEVIVSDRVHSITAVLSGESTINFKKIYALDWVDVKGCLMTLDRFYFDYSFEKNAFFIYTEDFSYFGSEGEIIGDPVSVNHAKDIKEVLVYDICGKLHINELDPLHCVVEREVGERRRIIDLILGNTVGEHTEVLKRCSNVYVNTENLMKQDHFVGTSICETETSQDQAHTVFATQSREHATSPVQNGDSSCSRTSSSSVENIMMCTSSQEECDVSSSNRQHSLQEKCAAEGDTSKENVVDSQEMSDCGKIDGPVLSEYDDATCSVFPLPVCHKKEKGVINFQGTSSAANFDLSIFTRKKKNKTSHNNNMWTEQKNAGIS